MFLGSVKTWHEKLGNHGIRKTVKNEEWGKVYRYCAHYRLEDPSRKRGDKTLKRTKRKTEVILGNRKFTWDQAWRNMKRAGVIVEPQLGEPNQRYFCIILADLMLIYRSSKPSSTRYHYSNPFACTVVACTVAAECTHFLEHVAAFMGLFKATNSAAISGSADLESF